MRLHALIRLCYVRKNGSTGWGDAFTSDAVVPPAKAAQYFHGGGSRDREQSMAGAYQAVAARQFRYAPRAMLQCSGNTSGRYYVYQRIPVRDFVEMYFVDWNPVRPAFGFSELSQNGECVFCRPGV